MPDADGNEGQIIVPEVIKWMKLGTTCQICEGFAHEWFECPTKRKLDYRARKNPKDKEQWGEWKYKKYWGQLTAAE